MTNNKVIITELSNLLYGRNAHATFEQAVTNFPEEFITRRVEGIEHSPWQLLEHMNLAQWDILDFMINPDYKERKFPTDYWPKEETADSQMWDATVKKFKADFAEVIKIIHDPNTDFFSPIPHAKDYTIYREILLLANHNSYHTGQIILLRKLLKIWN